MLDIQEQLNKYMEDLKNTTLNAMLLKLLPNIDQVDTRRLLETYNRHGVTTETLIEIAKDYAEGGAARD